MNFHFWCMKKQMRITVPQEEPAKSFKVNVEYQTIFDGPNRLDIRVKVLEDQELPEALKIREFSIEEVYSPGDALTAGITVTGKSHNILRSLLDGKLLDLVESRIKLSDEDVRNWKGFIRP